MEIIKGELKDSFDIGIMKFEKYIHIYTPEKMTKTIEIHETKIMNFEKAFSKIFSELVKFFDIKILIMIVLCKLRNC